MGVNWRNKFRMKWNKPRFIPCLLGLEHALHLGAAYVICLNIMPVLAVSAAEPNNSVYNFILRGVGG